MCGNGDIELVSVGWLACFVRLYNVLLYCEVGHENRNAYKTFLQPTHDRINDVVLFTKKMFYPCSFFAKIMYFYKRERCQGKNTGYIYGYKLRIKYISG